jgi:aspartyl-tRNA(Asn)/glutamyl-tRNA(Gln) amidotransferase subunit B
MLHATNTEVEGVKATPKHLVELLDLVERGIISGPAAKTVFEEMFLTGKSASSIIAEKDLGQISDTTEIENIIAQVITNNSQAVSDFKAGKQQSLAFLVGQVMKATKGRANPGLANKILLDKLGGN